MGTNSARIDSLYQPRVLVDEPRFAQHVRCRVLQLRTKAEKRVLGEFVRLYWAEKKTTRGVWRMLIVLF